MANSQDDSKSKAGGATRRTPLWAHLAGWYGAIAILWAYYGSSHGHLDQGAVYHLLNLSGAIGVGVVCWYQRTWQALVLEIAWATIAISSILQLS